MKLDYDPRYKVYKVVHRFNRDVYLAMLERRGYSLDELRSKSTTELKELLITYQYIFDDDSNIEIWSDVIMSI